MKLTTTPYKYQEEGINYLLNHHYAILADEMGLGKSLQAIGLACKVKAKAKKVLVVCPAYLKVNWTNEFKVHTDELKILMAKTKKCLTGENLDWAKVVIVNYEMVSELNFKPFDLVIADECQLLKNMKAKRTKAFHDNVRDCPPDRLLLLSGTPIKNRVPEFYSILTLCSYNPFRDSGANVKTLFRSEYSFSMKFCNRSSFRIRGREIVKFEGLKNKELLKKMLEGKYKRRLAKNVLDLLEPVDKPVLMSFSGDKLRKDWQDFLTKGMDAHMMSRKAISALAKSKFTINYVKGLLEAGEGPIVIFCDHVAPVNAMTAELGAKYRVRGITGAVDANLRGEYGQQFQNGQLDVLVATYGSGSTGLTLTKSNNMVLNSYPWVGADLDQALKRVQRISQLRRVTYHYILGSPLDEQILELVKKKNKTIKEVL